VGLYFMIRPTLVLSIVVFVIIKKVVIQHVQFVTKVRILKKKNVYKKKREEVGEYGFKRTDESYHGKKTYIGEQDKDGFHGIVKHPTYFWVGDKGPERVDVYPLRKKSIFDVGEYTQGFDW